MVLPIVRRVKKFFLPEFLTTFESPSRSQSMKILNCTDNNIMERYRDLMRINHPDKGGSAYICTKINEAKDFLLEDRRSL